MDFRIQVRRYKLPFKVPVRTAHGIWRDREGLLIRLEHSAGDVGYGEAASLPWFGTESVDQAEDLCRSLGDCATAEALDRIPHDRASVRNALGAARRAREPEPAGPSLAIAALLPAGRPALDRIKILGEAGFRVFKWKVGVADLADELGLFDDVCAQLPSGAKIRLDANGAWDRRSAERWLDRCAERPVEFIEQPIAAERRGAEDLLLGLAHDYPVPLALDESVASERDIDAWIDRDWPGIYVLKLSLLGDPASALNKLAAAGADVVFSSALETGIGARTNLRFAFGWSGRRRPLGFGVWPLFEDTRFDGPYAAPFLSWSEIARIDPEFIWNASI